MESGLKVELIVSFAVTCTHAVPYMPFYIYMLVLMSPSYNYICVFVHATPLILY